MAFYLNDSKARVHFKQMLGNANHLIVTTLVGLEAVDRRLIMEIPEDLHAAWNPKDQSNSARRSRRLLLDMALARAVDSLDVYIRRSRRKPELMQDEILQRGIDNAGRSIAHKLQVITEHYTTLPPVLVAMVSVMITWRNRAMHEEADTEINAEYRSVLQAAEVEIAASYRGLSVDLMLTGFERETPTFKEIASLIKATSDFIRELEICQFRNLNTEQYLRGLLLEEVNSEQSSYRLREAEMMRRLQSIWGKDEKARASSIMRLLQRLGLSSESKYGYSLAFDDGLITQLTQMRTQDIWSWLLIHTNSQAIG